MTAPGGRSPSDGAWSLMKASRTSARGSTAAMQSPAGSIGRQILHRMHGEIDGGRSTSASSISLVNRPLPPKSRKGLSLMRSPEVVMTLKSIVAFAQAPLPR